MKIAMFMLFFVCNMFTVLIMRFAYESNYRYNNGMLIGVHIPGDHVNDDDVTRLMTRFKKSMKYFQNINAVLSIAICFLNFVNIIISLLCIQSGFSCSFSELCISSFQRIGKCIC